MIHRTQPRMNRPVTEPDRTGEQAHASISGSMVYVWAACLLIQLALTAGMILYVVRDG